MNPQESQKPHSEDGISKTENEQVTDPEAEDSDQSVTRPLYVLFIVPVVAIALGISLGYIRHYLFTKVRNLISIVENHMLSVEEIDGDQTPVNVLERLDDESTFLYADSDLEWDDSTERNAELIVDEIHSEMGSNHSSTTSIINVNLDDYMNAIKVIEKITPEKDQEEDQCQKDVRTSTPKPPDLRSSIGLEIDSSENVRTPTPKSTDLRSSSPASKELENDSSRFM